MTAANKKFQQLKRKVITWKANDYTRDKQFEDKGEINVTTAEVVCQYCGFKARYQFIRCPECNEVQK